MTVDAFPDPQPGKEPELCLVNGEWVQIGSMSTPPSGLPSFTLTPLVQQAANWLELVKAAKPRCPVNLLFTTALCEPYGVFSNRSRAWVYRSAIITDHQVTNPMQRSADGVLEQPFSITTDLYRTDHWPMVFSRIATVGDAALNSVTACPGACAGACGSLVPGCTNLWMSADTVAAAIPDVVWSADGGATFTSPASGFAATESVMATQCIQLDSDTSRIVTVRDTAAAAPLEVAYSDDNAATWTLVNVGVTNAEAAFGGSSMFFFNPTNGWICTDDGRVFYSADYGVTWTDQTTALAASGAAALHAIHFATALIGYAVGAGDVIIYTLDGGENWAAGTATGSGDSLDTVYVFDAQRVIVGTNNGVSTKCVYMTFDQTANWTTIDSGLNALTTDVVKHAVFMPDGMTGFLVKNTAAAGGSLYKSIDGGRNWRVIASPTNSNLNHIHICSANDVFVVGEVNAATSFIGHASG